MTDRDPILDSYIYDQGKEDQMMELYNNTTSLLVSPGTIGGGYITQEMHDVSVGEVKAYLTLLVTDKSLPSHVSISSILIHQPRHLAEIYDSMNYTPENCPLEQEILFIKSVEKTLVCVLVEEKEEDNKVTFVRLSSLENSEDFLKNNYNPIVKEQEAIQKTEKQVLAKSLTKIINNNGERNIDTSFRQSNLSDIGEYIEYFQTEFNKTIKNEKQKLNIQEAIVEGDYHFQIILKDWDIEDGYLPAEERITVFFLKKGENVYVILPTLNEKLKVRIYGRNLNDSGLYIKGLWDNIKKKK